MFYINFIGNKNNKNKMNSYLGDDLNNKERKKGKIDPTPFSGADQQKSKGVNLIKNTYSNFVKNIKNLAMKKSPENSQTNHVDIASSQNVQEESKPKSCKDKLAQKIIAKVEVERNLVAFSSLLCLGSFMLCFSLFLIPLIITSPSKFSMCFSFGCFLVLISFLFYHGTKNFVTKLFDKNRFYIAILFVCSILIGLYFSLRKNYFISLFCSMFQLVSLILFILTLIPGGKKGIN